MPELVPPEFGVPGSGCRAGQQRELSRAHDQEAGATYSHSCPSPTTAATAARTPAADSRRGDDEKRFARGPDRSGAGRTSGRLITDRHTREMKKTTNAAAVNGSPTCQPNKSTAAAPNANSVSQKARNYRAVDRGATPLRNRAEIPPCA